MLCANFVQSPSFPIIICRISHPSGERTIPIANSALSPLCLLLSRQMTNANAPSGFAGNPRAHPIDVVLRLSWKSNMCHVTKVKKRETILLTWSRFGCAFNEFSVGLEAEFFNFLHSLFSSLSIPGELIKTDDVKCWHLSQNNSHF